MMEAILGLAPQFIQTHAAVLVVVIPLLGAAAAAFSLSTRLAWLVALVSTAGSAFAALVTMAQVDAAGMISYDLGGWAPPVGIEYRVDALNAPILVLVSVIALLCVIFGASINAREIAKDRRALFLSAFLMCVAGLLGVVITGDAFNIFVFLEISSLSTYVLVAQGAGRDRRALSAAFNYLILGTLGATFFVIGVGFLYMATGTLNLADMARLLAASPDTTVVRAGFAFILIGLALKAALYPLHTWLPGAYAFAPSIVTTFLAATATKVSLVVLVRFLSMVFDPQENVQELALTFIIAPLAAAGMVLGSILAVQQNDAKRVLAYSSVAQVGYILLGFAMATSAGIAAGGLHLFNHALMKGALFMALGIVALRITSRRIPDLAGLGTVMPVTSAAFAIGGLSLIGVPLTAGFVSKFALFNAAFAAGWWWAILVIAISSVLAVIYVGRMLETMYVRQPSEALRQACAGKSPPIAALVPLLILAGANIWFGVQARPLETAAQNAAAAVIAGPDTSRFTGGPAVIVGPHAGEGRAERDGSATDGSVPGDTGADNAVPGQPAQLAQPAQPDQATTDASDAPATNEEGAG